MGQIKLCDCTLSVGGAVNEGYFARDAIKEYFSRIGDSHIDYYSAGVLDIIPCGLDVAIYDSMESLRRRKFPGKNGQSVSTVTVVIGPQQPYAESLEPFQVGKTPEILRLVFQTQEVEQAVDYAAIGREKGYRIWLQPRCGASLSTSAWKPILQKAAALAPEAVFLDDGFGWLDCGEFLSAAHWLDEALSPGIALGLCIGNGKSQAFETARALFAQPLNHEIILDGCIGGMGSGGGVLPTEWAMEQLTGDAGDYQVDVLLELYTRTIFPNHRIHTWGPSPLSLIAAQARIDFRYLDFFREKLPVPVEDLAQIVANLPADKRQEFSEKAAIHAAYVCERHKTSLAIVIPTCNQVAAIDYLLGTSLWQARRYGIDYIIYDSSDNDKTETLVRQYQLDGYKNVIYQRYTGEFDGFSLDHKIIAAYQQYLDQYEYLWLCQDGLIVNLLGCFEQIHKCMRNGNDIIIVDSSFRHNGKQGFTQYDDPCDFFADLAQRIVTLGMLILSSDLAKKLIDTYPIDETNYSLWQMAVPFHYASEHPVSVVCYLGDVFLYNPVGTTNSFWNKAGKAMEQWAYYWHKVIMAMPDCYDAAKSEVLKLNMFDFHPFSLQSLLRMRGNGGLNLALIRKYQQYFPDICNTPRWKFHLAALMPRSVARVLVDRGNSRAGRLLYRVYCAVFRVGKEA